MLARQLESAEKDGRVLALAIRLRAAGNASPARHPAIPWRWESLADGRGPVAVRGPNRGQMTLAVQLGTRDIAAPRTLDRGGLRVLFMAYSPEDTQPVLDYEREEELVLGAVEPFVRKGRAQLRVVEIGCLDELERSLLDREYDVVHLSGHGIMHPAGPRLVMEDDVGGRVDVTPEQLLTVLRSAKRMPELVMISSCHSAGTHDDTPSLAAELVDGGLSAVIGWVQPVRDDLATEAAGAIYQRLCTGATPAAAVAYAREQLYKADQAVANPAQRSDAWSTLCLITREATGFRVDDRLDPLDAEPGDPDEVYTYLGEGRMRVLQRGFVGRRRHLQRLVRLLLHGKHAGVRRAGAVILGMKGVGKSCLAARAIQRVSQDFDDPSQLGLVVVHGQLDDATLYQQFEDLAMRWDDKKAEAIVGDASEPLPKRLRRLLTGHWSRRDLVIVLDDFEQNLETRAEGHARLSAPAAELLEALVPPAARAAPSSSSPPPPASSRATPRPWPSSASAPSRTPRSASSGPAASKARTAATWPPSRASPDPALRPPGPQSPHPRLGPHPHRRQDPRRGRSHHPRGRRRHAGVQGGEAPSEEAQNELARVFLRHMAYDEAIAGVSPDARTFIKRARVYDVAVPPRALGGLIDGLELDLEAHLPALQNLGLLEAGTFHGEPAYRVSPLVEPELDVEDPRRWHALAAEHWDRESQKTGRVEHLQMAWEHALRGAREDIAARAGRIVGVRLNHAGLYDESLRLAERQVARFPERCAGLMWAGYAAFRSGEPSRGWSFFERAETAAAAEGLDGSDLNILLGEAAQALAALGATLKPRAVCSERSTSRTVSMVIPTPASPPRFTSWRAC